VTNNLLLEAALSYVKNGWHIMPLRPLTKDAFMTGHPTSADPDQIKKWWGRQPNYNLGFPAKDNGLWLVDVDFKDVKSKEDRELLDKVLAEFPDNVPRAITANDGFHYYFRPGKIPFTGAKKDICPGMQIRQSGYYVVAPPSIYMRTADKDGPEVAGTLGHYRWEKPLPLNREEIPEWPELKSVPWEQKKGQLGAAVVKGGRHDRLIDLATHLRTVDDIKYEPLVAALFKHAETFTPPLLRSNPADVAEIEQLADWAIKKVEPLKSAKERNAARAKAEQAAFKDRLFTALSDKLIAHSQPEGEVQYYAVADRDKRVVRPLRMDFSRNNSPGVNFIVEAADLQSPKQIGDAKAWIEGLYPRTKDPVKPFGWPGEDGWVIQRAPKPITEGPFPHWEEFLNRCSSREDVMAYLYSIFIEEHSRQVLWLYEPFGMTGKSSVINALSRFMGPAAGSLVNAVVQNDRFLLSAMLNKRLVTWGECPNTKFLMTENLKALTTGDTVLVDIKGQAMVTHRIRVKFIFGSNRRPAFTSGGGHKSRIIPVEVQAATNDTPDFPERLYDELPHMLFAARELYARKCPDKGQIRLDDTTKDIIDKLAKSNEVEHESAFAALLTLEDKALIKPQDVYDRCRGELRFTKNEYDNFKEWLITQQGIREVRRREGGKTRTYWEGVAFKDGAKKHIAKLIQES